MHDDSALVEARLNRFVRERLQPAIYRATAPLTVTAWAAPGEPVSFAEAVSHPFTPFVVGSPWGRPWGTVWFHLTGLVPPKWAGLADTRIEVVLDLGFTNAAPGFQVEGTAYTPDGRLVKGIESLNRTVAVTGTRIDLYIEAAANPNIAVDFSFTPTPLGDLDTAGERLLYSLRQADVAVRDTQVWQLVQDVVALDGLRRELPAAWPRRANILRALERCLDLLDPDDVGGTALQGRAALADVLASPANASSHRVHAVGHAHIDSAWLWPVRETVRKVARTFSNVLDLIDRHPDFVFAASSAQQYAWLLQFYPELFDRVRRAVAAGNFVPVGGMWVESDTNMPGGEALARQFVAGKGFFLREFGVEPLEVWLPDSFGYSAALPQIVRAAGSRWFLTQKLSWNDTNVFPHHSFLWEGLDGSRIFTHFPPVADYNAQLSGLELARAERMFAEKGAANTSLVPFGWGGGGGGPTEAVVRALCSPGDGAVVLNAGPYAQGGVPALGGLVHGAESLAGATIARTPDGWVLANRHVRVTIDTDGLFSSIWDRHVDRQVVPDGARANLLTLHRDTPTQWDAWDIDAPHARLFEALTDAESVEQLVGLPFGQVGVRITRRFGSSSVIEDVTLTGESSAIDLAFDIDWHERQKLLRLNFALDIMADRAASEI